MKLVFTVILITIAILPISSQEINIKRIDKNYTWRNVTGSQIDSFYYNIMPLQDSQKFIHLKIFFNNQIVEILSEDGYDFEAVLTNTISRYKSSSRKDSDFDAPVEIAKVFQKIKLDRNSAKEIYKSIIDSGLLEIPTDKLISKWNNDFLHCYTISIQSKNGNQFSTQDYFCPFSQDDSIIAKKTIIENVTTIRKAFDLDSLYKQFVNELPKGNLYSKDGYRMMYVMSEREYTNWSQDKPRREYLKEIKNEVDSYIKLYLGIQNFARQDINCFEDYNLTFATNGLLKEVEIHKYEKPKLRNSLGLKDFVDEKKEIRKCKEEIASMLSKLDLSFINLQYEVQRTLSIDLQGNYVIRDQTVY